MIKRYKSKNPVETVHSIKKMLVDARIEVIQNKMHNVGGFYSLTLQIKGTSLFVNGKGSTEDYTLASAYGELAERLLSNVLLRFKHRYPSNIVFQDKNLIIDENFDVENINKLLHLDFTKNEYKLLQDYFFKPIEEKIICESYFELDTNRIERFPVATIDALYNTNGIAYGNDFYEASVQALSEIFERYINREILNQEVILPRIRDWKQYVSDDLALKIQTLLKSEGITLEAIDCSFGGKYPVVAILLLNENSEYFVKFGAHFSFEIAFERCFTELFQGRNFSEDFWKKRIYLDLTDQNAKTMNLENVMLNGDGYYQASFFDNTIEIENLKYDFGSQNEVAYYIFIKIIRQISDKIYWKQYSVENHYVVRYIVPLISNLVLSKKGILFKYSSILYHTNQLLNFLYISSEDRSQFLKYLIDREINIEKPIYTLAKYPIKNPATLEYINYQYLLGVDKLLNGNYTDILQYFLNGKINSNVKTLIEILKDKTDLTLMPEMVEHFLFYPKEEGRRLLIGNQNISQEEALIDVYRNIQKYIQQKKAEKKDVILVSMPFDSLDKPSLGIGLLVSAAKKRNISIKAHYTKFNFAEKIGYHEYNYICNHTETSKLPGEYIFSKIAFGIDNKKDYIEQVVKKDSFRLENTDKMLKHHKIELSYVELLEKATEMTEEFIKEEVDKILAYQPKVVACSSMFEQNCASLALLKEIKRRQPLIKTIMGGANCEDELGVGIIESFDWIDFVISGEGDNAFPELCNWILKQNYSKTHNIPEGVITKDNVMQLTPYHFTATTPTSQIYCPDYDDYFAALEKYAARNMVEPMLLVESSRGCWWGENEKRRCRFCGLNGTNAEYRLKDTGIVVDELGILREKYKINKIFFSDNIISMNCFDNLFPQLAAQMEPYQLHLETKANLREHHIKGLKSAGTTWIQPGIENLQDDALKALGKGTRAINNVQLLKMTQIYKINTVWNYLAGIPGDCDNWYQEVVEWIETIAHLQPPSGIYDLRIDKFSLFERNSKEFDIEIKESLAYSIVYPKDQANIHKLCRFFEYTKKDGKISQAKIELSRLIFKWKSNYFSLQRPKLLLYNNVKTSYIKDTRLCATNEIHELRDESNLIYLCCFEAKEISGLKELLREKYSIDISQNLIDKSINDLCKKKLLLRLNNFVLALAVPINMD
jgi:ribosomal peptide maturation radical SAM protein 1